MDSTNHSAILTFNLKSIKEYPSVVADFELYSQLKTDKKVEVTDWVRQRLVVPPNTTQTIVFGTDQVVNLLYMESQSKLMLDLVDAGSLGFGEGGFGDGGFGGTGNELRGFHINGIFCVEGDYQGLVVTNDTGAGVVVDLFAAVYA